MSRTTSSSILDRPLGKGVRGGSAPSSADTVVSLSAYALVYSEMVQYHQSRSSSVNDLERRLESSGYGVGFKILELMAYRNRDNKRETRLMGVLQFISSTVWKALFGKAADSLERSIDHIDEYMIVERDPMTSTFISIPPDLGQFSADAYISGIIAGVLEGAGFSARVTAHSVKMEEGEKIIAANNTTSPLSSSSIGLPPRKDKAVFLVKLAPQVLERETALEK